jgi:hypothetical protein
MEKYEKYLEWKKNKIKKVIEGISINENFDANKNLEEIQFYLNEKISKSEILKFEKETLEKEKYNYVIINGKYITYYDFIQKIFEESNLILTKEWKYIERELNKDSEYENLEIHKDIIREVLQEEIYADYITNNKVDVVDIYGFDYKFQEKYKIDNLKKEIIRIGE